MLRKLLRVLFTGLGGLAGYGVFLLGRFLMELTGYGEKFVLTGTQELGAAVVLVIIFGLIFYKLAQKLRKQGNKVANDIATDLQKVSRKDLVMGNFGLIIGCIV